MPQAAKPATISGPGAMSRRTDGGPASKQAQRYISGMPNYGDGQELMDLQASAPMAQASAPSMPSKTAINQAAMQGGQQGAPMQQPSLVPLNAPTQRPNEPITTGLDMGPGAGSSILGMQPNLAPQPNQSAKQTIQTLASHPNASEELKNLANLLGR